MTTSKSFGVDIISINCNATVSFPIYGQFAAIQNPDSGHMDIKLTCSLTVTFYLSKTENRAKRSITQLS